MSTTGPDSLVIRKPDDWHVHLRDGDMLRAVLPGTEAHFGRAIIMPNLVPPITTVAAAQAYRDRILAARAPGSDFQPLMTAYLTDGTDPDEIARGHAESVWVAAKLYPAGATTNAHHGVTDLAKIRTVLERMEKIGMPLLVHGETTDQSVDIFDREAVFIERHLHTLLREHPGLRVVFEHITTQEAADFVSGFNAQNPGGRVGATITPHHLMINRSSIFQGGIRPHLYCLPIAKREKHRLALRKAATSGDACFFLGTDTAPHMAHLKEAACGCAGIFCAAVAMACYAQVFDEEGALDRLNNFASLNGPRFYGLPVNTTMLTLMRRESVVQESVTVGADKVLVFRGGDTLGWSVES